LARASRSERLLDSELTVLNLGLDIFKQALIDQKVKCAQVELRQAPRLEKKLADALRKLL
jgi:hypothetical protein